eukprot:TRINITY_DN14809_c0_g1_i1.p2 TRINITY_DN14809_c0_g1~~TRINITY_DN14809_c0_g1_i1.p2  ORF type:complete len:119 (-),score=24.43 TRINITY_DN14809_c0_g1_i1:33-389(-)
MPPRNAERLPATVPADYAAMDWTAQVKAAALVAPAGEPLEWAVRVPLAGVYEVILGWATAPGGAPNTTVMDVQVVVDGRGGRTPVAASTWTPSRAAAGGCGRPPAPALPVRRARQPAR